MKKTVIVVILTLCNLIVTGQGNFSRQINLADLEGKWYIVQSNFPMWLKGNKASPTFNYGLVHKKTDTLLSDKVEYFKNGKTKSINGIDKSQNTNNSKFVWRGKGVLFFLKSKWEILHFDPDEQWAIIYFEKTLFTPEGYDVISRSTKLHKELEQDVKEKLYEFGIEQKLTTIAHKNR